MQRGFTLVEITVALGILAVLVLAGASWALGSRPMAVRTASTQIAAQLQAARSLAATTGNGATLIVQPGSSGRGFKSILYAGRPNRPPLGVSNTPSVTSDSEIRETTVGAPPFAIFIASGGGISIQGGYPPSGQFDSPSVPLLGLEPDCPAAGGYLLVVEAGGSSDTIALPCRVAVSGGPLAMPTASPTP